MASTDRRSDRDLIAEIGEQAPCFRFFQAVRLLALTSRERSVPRALRFGSPLSLGFPASEIVGIDPSPAFIAAAQNNAKSKRPRFEVGDAQALKLPDASFDIVMKQWT